MGNDQGSKESKTCRLDDILEKRDKLGLTIAYDKAFKVGELGPAVFYLDPNQGFYTIENDEGAFFVLVPKIKGSEAAGEMLIATICKALNQLVIRDKE